MSSMNDDQWTDNNRPFQIAYTEDMAVNLHHDGSVHYTDFDGGGEFIGQGVTWFQELQGIYTILNRFFRGEGHEDEVAGEVGIATQIAKSLPGAQHDGTSVVNVTDEFGTGYRIIVVKE